MIDTIILPKPAGHTTKEKIIAGVAVVLVLGVVIYVMVRKYDSGSPPPPLDLTTDEQEVQKRVDTMIEQAKETGIKALSDQEITKRVEAMETKEDIYKIKPLSDEETQARVKAMEEQIKAMEL